MLSFRCEGFRMTAWFLGLVTSTIKKDSIHKTLIRKANTACSKQAKLNYLISTTTLWGEF